MDLVYGVLLRLSIECFAVSILTPSISYRRRPVTPHRNTCRQGIPHTPCPGNGCLKDNHAGHDGFSTSVYRKPINLCKCCKNVSYLGTELQNLVCRCCAAHRSYNLSDRSSGIPLCTCRCFVSWGRVQECQSCYLKGDRTQAASDIQSSIRELFLLNVSQSLTLVAVWLTLTLGFLRVSVLIFILIAWLALGLLTGAEGRHAGPWKTRAWSQSKKKTQHRATLKHLSHSVRSDIIQVFKTSHHLV